jgi:leucyl aminopeptidase
VVPTPLARVELSDLARRGTLRAAVIAPAEATEDAGERESADEVWLGPGAEALLGDWQPPAELTGKAGELHPVPAGAVSRSAARSWLVGVGARRPVDWRTAGAVLARAADEALSAEASAAQRVVEFSLPTEITAEELEALVLGLLLGGYRFRVTEQAAKPKVRTVRLHIAEPSEPLRAALQRATVLASATALTRDLANAPSDLKDPAWLADIASKVGGAVTGLAVTVRDEHWLTEQRFGGMLAVGGGSSRPPRLIELAWRPRGAKGPHLVIVGKGITFDTGGLSLKRGPGMQLMRTDMAGGGAVIAALRAIAELQLPIRVTGLVPAAENHVSGSSYRPGDVVRHYGGRTTEVLNTDAEGRMVLADGLAYAVRALKADVLVDVATLTGAMKVTLGVRTGGLFASTDELAAQVSAAGAAVGEAWWRMPLLDSAVEDITSDIADARQMGRGPHPSSIHAALFLREFTAGLPWAHLDIAGPARADAAYAEVTAGASGFAARTLVALAESVAG